MIAVMDNLEALNQTFETAYPQDILRWAATQYGDKLAVVTSFQPTGIVTLHMLSEIAPNTTVLTLDTGLLFPETYALMDEVTERLGLRVRRVRPGLSVAQQAAAFGNELWADKPDHCCYLRKVEPLNEALMGYKAWITGVRRDQSPRRQSTPVASRDPRSGKVKISPLATWTEEMIWSYIHAYELPYNTLHDQNYFSIGCAPCTLPVAPDALDKRAGRWSGHEKTECGIHVTIAAAAER